VAVNLNIGSSSTATITLLGAAHGSVDIALSPAASASARRFAHVNLLTGGRLDSEKFLCKSLEVIRRPHPPVVQP
jgi:hypothetical protein